MIGFLVLFFFALYLALALVLPIAEGCYMLSFHFRMMIFDFFLFPFIPLFLSFLQPNGRVRHHASWLSFLRLAEDIHF